jgi:hypothetical protein
MAKKNSGISIPDEIVLNKIYLIREEKVMLDRDLAELYGVDTGQLKRQVRRNIDRFPEDFMFELNKEEHENLRSQFGISSWGGARYTPMAFTEQGVAQLSSVLNSERAIAVNIQIIRLFTRMRKLILTHQEVFAQLEAIRKTVTGHDERIDLIFEYIGQLEQSKQQELNQQNRKKIGYSRED